MLPPEVRNIHTTEIPVLASFLAEVFADHGIYIHIFPEAKTRKERLEWLFEKNLLLQKADKNTWVMTAANVGQITRVSDIIATITFLPSAEKKSTVVDYIKKGLLAMPFRFGFRAFRSLLQANKLNEDGISQIAESKPYWYLSMVAVAGSHRKMGIASRLINALFEHNANAFQKGYTSILLSTQQEANVSLYNRLGFTTLDAKRQHGYGIWFMKKRV